MLRVLVILAALMVSVGAFAQVYPDDNPFTSPGGAGGGGDDGSCKVCMYGGTTEGDLFAYCENRLNAPYPGGFGFHFPSLAAAYSSCQAHNAVVGPPYCEASGYCVYIYEWTSNRSNTRAPGSPAEHFKEQADAIALFLRDGVKSDGSHLISSADADDFEALVIDQSETGTIADREQRRLHAYRSKFAQLMGRELHSGMIPVMPHQPMKTPASITAEAFKKN